MALSKATLRTGLIAIQESITPGETEDEWAEAYGDYMAQATATPGPGAILTAAIPTAVAAMAGAMSFSTSGNAAAQIKSGLDAFWGIMVASPTLFWAGAASIVKPTFSSLTTALNNTFDDNTDNAESKYNAMDAIADDSHGKTDNQGQVVMPGPTSYTIT